MSEWKEIEIANVVISANTGLDAIKRAPIVEKNTGIKCLRIQDISQSKSYCNWGFTEVEQRNFEKFQLKKNDIIIARTGATIGVNLLIKENLNSVFNNGLIRVRTNKNLCDPIFLYYNFRSNNYYGYIESISGGTSTQPNMQINALLRYEISLPPLPEQTAIASILSSLDDKIDLLHRQNATLEKMAETLFRQWFVEEAKEEWETGCLGDFLQPQKGRNITKSEAIEGKFPVVAGGLEPSCFHNQSNTKAPVITISASGANAGFVRLYYTPIWSSDSSFIDESITPYVFFFYIFLKFNQERLFDKQEGSAQPHIYPSHIMELELPKIPISLISNFESEISPLFYKIKFNKSQIRTLTSLRDTLLPKLMSGEVRVEY